MASPFLLPLFKVPRAHLPIAEAISFVRGSGLSLSGVLFQGGICFSFCGFGSSLITCFLEPTVSRFLFMIRSSCRPKSAGLPHAVWLLFIWSLLHIFLEAARWLLPVCWFMHKTRSNHTCCFPESNVVGVPVGARLQGQVATGSGPVTCHAWP